MRTSTKVMVALAACLVASIGPSADAAVFENIGFEAGEDGWTYTDTASGTHAICEAGTCFGEAYDGDRFLRLEAGDAGVDVTASQQFELAEGETISGAARFFANDTLFRDAAAVTILDAEGAQAARPWFADTVVPGPNTWTPWLFTAPASATYTVIYSVRNAVDPMVDSSAIFDAVETSLDASGAFLDGTSLTMTLRATLTRGNGIPMPGKMIRFSAAGSHVCSAETNVDGTASCGGLVGATRAVVGATYTASFGGDTDGNPATGQGPLLR